MASLRKKPDAAIVADPPAVAANPETASPSPAPATPLASSQDDTAAEALRSQLEALKQAETMQQQAQIAQLAAEDRRREWLQKNSLAQKFYNHLGAFHNEAIQAGAADTSPQYFEHMESRLAALDAQQQPAATNLADEMQQWVARDRAPEPPQRSPGLSAAHMSAPVSREVPGSNGKRQSGRVTLTREEQEMAKVAGITVEEYAAQKLRLQHLRDTGQYSEERRS